MAITKVSRGLLNTGVSDSSDATAITIDSNENVLIGTTSGSDPLVVSDSGASSITARFINTNADANPANIRLQKNSSSPADGDYLGMINVSGNTETGAEVIFQSIDFISTDVSDSTEDGIIVFRTRGSGTLAERVRISDSGDVLVGTTTVNSGTLGPNNTFLEVAAGTNSGSGTIVLSRTTSGNNNEVGGLRFVNSDNADDDGLDSDGKLVAAVSARSVTSDSNAGDDSGADLVFYTKPEAGNYAERARFLSSGGLTFNGDTATANALDDYEEGTWTPSSSSNGTVSNAQGFYVKIGKMVHVLFYFSLSGVSTSTSVNVAGMPFAVQDNIGPSNVGGTGVAFGDLTNFLVFAQEASSLLTIEYDRPISGTAATSANLRGSVTYMTAL